MLKLKSLVAALTLGAALLMAPAAVDAAVRHHPTSTRTVQVKHKKRAAKKRSHRRHGKKASVKKHARKHALATSHKTHAVASHKTVHGKTVPVSTSTHTASRHHPLM
jgi:hypothetical protein